MSVSARRGISLPMINQSLSNLSELARAADSAGFDSVWNYEFFKNPFTSHSLNAVATSRVTLATGLATAMSRTPWEMANAAADVDELSDGRLILGLGLGGAGWASALNGADLDDPLGRLREYMTAVRAMWSWMDHGEPFECFGRHVKARSPQRNPGMSRKLRREQIPIYLGAMRPGMLRLAGEMADGVLAYLVTPDYVSFHIRPHIEAGAASVGRDASDIELAALVICAVDEDRARARRLARINVGSYVVLPMYERMAEAQGLSEERNHVLAALAEHGPNAFATSVPDALVDAFSISGTPEEARDQYDRFAASIDHVVLHTPYWPPISQSESERVFRNNVAAFGR